MKTQRLFGIFLLFLCVISFASCGDDDDAKDPSDALMLNMLNEENGKTLLGTSDVYINKSHNFKTSSCYIADVGTASGLGTNVQPTLNNLAREVAVIPGHLYQIYDQKTLQDFPSGKRAILLGASYYKMYVVSPITTENTTTGAIVKYVLAYPETQGLPENETIIGNLDYAGESFEYTLPKDAECVFNEYWHNTNDAFDMEIANNKLKVTLLKPIDKISGPYGTYQMYIRSGSTFTIVKVNVGMSK